MLVLYKSLKQSSRTKHSEMACLPSFNNEYEVHLLKDKTLVEISYFLFTTNSLGKFSF
jgi:hypothetical protein